MESDQQLKRFQDKTGKISILPSKPSKRLLVLRFLASQFEMGKFYGEKEVNGILNKCHNFNDPAWLRRELIERGLLARTDDGKKYWRKRSIVPT